MNERVLQFRLGIFVMIAGVVLAMMIIWFGEAPSLFRNQVYVKVRFAEAPGVGVGTPVRKLGIKVGEVEAVAFDARSDKPDGVLVTMRLDPDVVAKPGTVPRISRALIGDVTIDFQPAANAPPFQVAKTSAAAPIYENGEVSADPSVALAKASSAIEQVDATLVDIRKAASGIARVSDQLDGARDFLTTWKTTGQQVNDLAVDLRRIVQTNEADITPAIKNLREVSEKVNGLLDAETRAKLKTTIDRLEVASAGFEEVRPLLKDLGANSRALPTTNMGQAVFRFNRIAHDLSLLTSALNDGQNRLNTNGSLQKLIVSPELYNNFNKAALAISSFLAGTRPMVENFTKFAQRIANDPAAISRGALQRQ